MVALPLALTATYSPPYEDGEYAHVIVHLNGQPLLRIVSDDPVAHYSHREEQAITDAIESLLVRLFEGDVQVAGW